MSTTTNTKIEKMKTSDEIEQIITKIKVYSHDELTEGQKGFCYNNEMWQHNKDAEPIRKMCKNNLIVALFFECLPKICDIFKKYEGKQNGEKTNKKIREEMSTACNGLSIWYNNKEIHITKNNTTFTIYLNSYKTNILDGYNKIVALPTSEFFIYENYIEEPQKALENMRDLLAKINEKEAEIDKMREEFNLTCCKGIQKLQYHGKSYCHEI